MKSKEEIFNEHSFKEIGGISPSKSFCLKAMDEYAKEVAIAFCKWVDDNGYTQTSNKSWANLSSENISDEQLFEMFKKQNNIQ